MRTISTTLSALLFSSLLLGQTEVNKLHISAGPSWHGTGDMGGFAVNLMYEHAYSRRFSFSNGLTTTIHHKKDRGFNSLISGVSPEDRLMRFTTAGFQVNSSAQFYLIAWREVKLSVEAGAILRFQSTSYPSVYGYSQDPRYPEPFYVFYQYDKPNSLSPGYHLGVTYRNLIARKYFVGINASLQNDRHADIITSITLLFERVLTKLQSGE